jgi:hypothetical protein
MRSIGGVRKVFHHGSFLGCARIDSGFAAGFFGSARSCESQFALKAMEARLGARPSLVLGLLLPSATGDERDAHVRDRQPRAITQVRSASRTSRLWRCAPPSQALGPMLQLCDRARRPTLSRTLAAAWGRARLKASTSRPRQGCVGADSFPSNRAAFSRAAMV